MIYYDVTAQSALLKSISSKLIPGNARGGKKRAINTCWREKAQNTTDIFILDWISYSIMLDCAHQENLL